MKFIIYPIILAAIATSANAREIRLEDCPVGVQRSIEAKLEGGRVDDIESVIRNGKIRYVVDIEGPVRRDLTVHMSPSGRVIFESEDLTFRQCPVEVQKTISRLLKMKVSWSLDDIDQVTNSKGTRFHVDIDRRGRLDLDLVISSDGVVLSRKVERFDP
jgi:hypothetical protein